MSVDGVHAGMRGGQWFCGGLCDVGLLDVGLCVMSPLEALWWAMRCRIMCDEPTRGAVVGYEM